jgi:MFS family permease
MAISRDRFLLYAAAFLRALATGMIAVLIGIHLAKIGFDPRTIGLVVTAGLTGAAVAALVVTLSADRIGRKRALLGLAVLGALGGGKA